MGELNGEGAIGHLRVFRALSIIEVIGHVSFTLSDEQRDEHRQEEFSPRHGDGGVTETVDSRRQDKERRSRVGDSHARWHDTRESTTHTTSVYGTATERLLPKRQRAACMHMLSLGANVRAQHPRRAAPRHATPRAELCVCRG